MADQISSDLAVPYRGVLKVDLGDLPKPEPGGEPLQPTAPVLDEVLAAQVARAQDGTTTEALAEVGWKAWFPPFVKRGPGDPDAIYSEPKMAACAYDLRLRSVMSELRGAIR